MPLVYNPYASRAISTNFFATAGRDVYTNRNGHPYRRGLVEGGGFSVSDAVARFGNAPPRAAAGGDAPAAAASARAPAPGAADGAMLRELRDAAATGRGITVAELATIVRRHEADGPSRSLTATERDAIRAAIDDDMFSTSAGVERARALLGR